MMEIKKTTWYLPLKKHGKTVSTMNDDANCRPNNSDLTSDDFMDKEEEVKLCKNGDRTSVVYHRSNSKHDLIISINNGHHQEVAVNCAPTNRDVFVKSNHDQSVKKINRRRKLLQELVDTEKDYVYHLKLLVNDYLELLASVNPIPVPASLSDGKFRIIFGNVGAIYEFHRDFMLKEIGKCLEKPSHLCFVFDKFQRKLNLYVVYSQNKDKSNCVIAPYLNNYFEEVRNYLGHQLRLPDLLIKPIQRVMKYELILCNLIKYTKEAGILEDLNPLEKALQSMKIVPRITNDMMILSRLVNYEGSIMNHGKLIRQGYLMVSRNQQPTSPLSISLHFTFNLPRSTYKKRYIFLFEQIILFCKVSSKNHFSNYIYKFHLNTTNISVNMFDQHNNDNQGFHICLKDSPNDEINFPIICEADNLQEKQAWINDIQRIINFQDHFINSLVSPIVHQNQITS